MDESQSENLGDGALNVKQIGPKPTMNHYSGADFKTYKEWMTDALLSLEHTGAKSFFPTDVF